MDGSGFVEEGLDDAPGCLDAVFPGEAGRVALKGVAEQTFVGLSPRAQRVLEVDVEAHGSTDETITRFFGLHAEGHPVVV